MKFYVLRHPEKGYLSSKKYFNPSWTGFIERAKKWSFKSHPKSMMKQTHNPIIRECEVLELEYIITTPHLTRMKMISLIGIND